MNWIADALDYSLSCIRRTLERVDGFPERTEGGSWVTWPDGWWVGGHWVGLLWKAFALTQDPTLEAAARTWAARLEKRAMDGNTHDLGFLFELSHVLGWQITGDTSLLMPALPAARTLAARFHACGHFLQAWGPVGVQDERCGRSIIDTLMNLELLFWAGQYSGESSFAQIAASHARTAQAFQVRADGSTAHVADFDPETGRFLGQATHQGLSATSCWSRGQAWAVYGFSRCHAATGEPSFLETAQKTADYALAHNPSDRVPYWDYASPQIPNDVRDSSAAAALASGLLALSEVEPHPERVVHWRREAKAILESLWNNYSSRGSQEPSILIHGTRSKPHSLADHGLIYGDYYFVEALLKLNDLKSLSSKIW